MIKNILLVVMTILALMFFVFGYIQKIEADRQVELAVASKIEAEKRMMEVEKAKLMVVAAQAEADKQRALAIECQMSKKK